MTDETPVQKVEATVTSDAAKAEAEVSFVRQNWVKLSGVVIAAAVLGLVIAKLL